MKLFTVLGILLVLVAGGWAFFFGPYYVDSLKMEDVAGSAALTWVAFDEAKGRAELAEQLRRREIPDYFTPESCRFYGAPGDQKVVDCAWTVDVYLPVVDQTRRLSFHVKKTASADGRLVD